MRAALVLALLLAACGEKMTPERCVSVWSRASACMDPNVEDVPAEVASDHDMFDELCTDDEMMRVASEAEGCLRTNTTCAAFRACFKQPSLRLR